MGAATTDRDRHPETRASGGPGGDGGDGDNVDIAILGGGLAGLTLAIEAGRMFPDKRIAVLERLKPPYPVAAHKVGESTVELGSHYLRGVIGAEYLEKHQIRKAGVRMFFTADGNRDIARRPEFGTNSFLPIHTYQVDRGILENRLWEAAAEAGVDMRPGCRLTGTAKEEAAGGSGRHRIDFVREGRTESLSTRWMVDATGRGGFLKRQFGLAADADHSPNAAWLRIGMEIDVETWSDDGRYRSRFPEKFRWRATNHLVGDGYWVWIIPLISGSTSIGIVASDERHPFSRIRSLDHALEWLREYEPQCAALIDENREKIQDFAALRHYAHGCTQLFSADRWALVGEAGVFSDPFLSPGTDFIAIGNMFVMEMLRRDFAGENPDDYIGFANDTMQGLFGLILGWFRALYPVLGKSQATMLWIGWYFALYVSVPVTLARYRAIADQAFMGSIQGLMQRFAALSLSGIRLLADWAENCDPRPDYAFIDIFSLKHVIELQKELVAADQVSPERLRSMLERNIAMLEASVIGYRDILSGDNRIVRERYAGMGPYQISGALPPDAMAAMPPAMPNEDIVGNIRGLWYQD